MPATEAKTSQYRRRQWQRDGNSPYTRQIPIPTRQINTTHAIPMDSIRVIAIAYILRVYFVQGFYIVSYGLGIYVLNLLIAFLSPQVDPEIQELTDGPSLPTHGSDEFRPFVRRLPEFKFWYSLTKAFCIAFVMTFFSVFDVPVFWPILLVYWFLLFTLTMRRQIHHMIKYKYVPFSLGKKRYDQRKLAVDEISALVRD